MEGHHVQQEAAEDRPGYRESRRERAVKVYTVNQESKYLLVQNVHALGVTKELLELFSLYGDIAEFRLLDEFPTEDYCDVYWIKFTRIDSARIAKKKLDNWSFYGKSLHICYAPEYESLRDTREKLVQRRKRIAQKTQEASVRTGDCMHLTKEGPQPDSTEKMKEAYSFGGQQSMTVPQQQQANSATRTCENVQSKPQLAAIKDSTPTLSMAQVSTTITASKKRKRI